MKLNNLTVLFEHNNIVNRPYTILSEHRRSDVRPFNHIGGLRPYINEDQTMTSAKAFNSEIAKRNVDDKAKEEFYLGIAHKMVFSIQVLLVLVSV